jgi:hypothetical protein
VFSGVKGGVLAEWKMSRQTWEMDINATQKLSKSLTNVGHHQSIFTLHPPSSTILFIVGHNHSPSFLCLSYIIPLTNISRPLHSHSLSIT